ncbi:unnamed protein product, partial [marine sediment metagenome]
AVYQGHASATAKNGGAQKEIWQESAEAAAGDYEAV